MDIVLGNARFALDDGIMQPLARNMQITVRDFYSRRAPLVQILDITAPSIRGAHYITTNIRQHSHAVIDGRRVKASPGVGLSAPDSIIQAQFANTR